MRALQLDNWHQLCSIEPFFPFSLALVKYILSNGHFGYKKDSGGEKQRGDMSKLACQLSASATAQMMYGTRQKKEKETPFSLSAYTFLYY